MACSSCGGGSTTTNSNTYSYASTQTGSGGCGSCSASTDCGCACGCDECSTGSKCCPDLGTGSESCDKMRHYNDTKIKELFCFVTKLDPCRHLMQFLSKAFGRIWCLLNNIINNICALWDEINLLRGVPEDDLHANWYKAIVAKSTFVNIEGTNKWYAKGIRPQFLLVSRDDFDSIYSIVGQHIGNLGQNSVQVFTQQPIRKGVNFLTRYEVILTLPDGETPEHVELGFVVIGAKKEEVI